MTAEIGNDKPHSMWNGAVLSSRVASAAPAFSANLRVRDGRQSTKSPVSMDDVTSPSRYRTSGYAPASLMSGFKLLGT